MQCFLGEVTECCFLLSHVLAFWRWKMCKKWNWDLFIEFMGAFCWTIELFRGNDREMFLGRKTYRYWTMPSSDTRFSSGRLMSKISLVSIYGTLGFIISSCGSKQPYNHAHEILEFFSSFVVWSCLRTHHADELVVLLFLCVARFIPQCTLNCRSPARR